MKSKYKNPNHKVHVANFVKKNPSAKSGVPDTIILVDLQDWAVELTDLTGKKNTTECCQVCSIAEGIAQAENGIGTTGLGQVCFCQWKNQY
jgi:hypothetical protein